MKYILPILCLLLIGCDHADDRLTIGNYSKKEIAVEFFYDSIPVFHSSKGYNYYKNKTIKPNQVYKIPQGTNRNAWLYFFDKSSNKQINMMLFDIKELQKHNDLDSLVMLGKYYGILSFTKEEMESVNWRIDIH